MLPQEVNSTSPKPAEKSVKSLVRTVLRCPLVFSGSFEATISASGRVALPTRWFQRMREASHEMINLLDPQTRERVVLVTLPDISRPSHATDEAPVHRILLFRECEYRAGIVNKLPASASAEAHTVTLTQFGRLTIPYELLGKAGITPGQGVTLNGAIDHIEIWSPKNFMRQDYANLFVLMRELI